jgi:NAD(P)-dependent dehydrogenase (short-subunit alcohol dehydrogenase family)
MHGLLEGKVAVITGAGSGVGRAAVKLWTENGAKVIAADINLPSVEESVRLAGAPQGAAQATVCNVADPAQVEAMVQLAVETFGRLDVMYSNAGITIMPKDGGQGVKSFLEASPEEIKRVEDVNINGVFYGAQSAIRQFERQEKDANGIAGVIVNTASVAGLIGYGGVVYGSSKGAVTGFTRTLAIEMADKGIRVNSVCPAGMLTHYMGMDPDSAHKDRILEMMGKGHPLGRSIDPADTAAAAMFLASDLASNITGVNLPVDGGLTAGRKTGG